MIVTVLSQARSFDKELEIIVSLFDNGLQVFHLRKPNYSKKQVCNFIESIPRKYWNRIILHHHYSLAFKLGLMGIHINKKRKKQPLRTKLLLLYYKFKRPDLHVSTSFSNLSNLFEDGGRYDYVFLSPIFDSISKSGYQSAFSHHNLRMALGKTKHNVLALGGVRPENVSQIKDMGFAGMVLSGVIWEDEQPLKVFKEVLNKI